MYNILNDYFINVTSSLDTEHSVNGNAPVTENNISKDTILFKPIEIEEITNLLKKKLKIKLSFMKMT
jgi:hypothetical protein